MALNIPSFGQFFGFPHPNRLAVQVSYNDFNRALQERDLNHVSSETFDRHEKAAFRHEDRTENTQRENQEMQIAGKDTEDSPVIEEEQTLNETAKGVEETNDGNNHNKNEEKVEDERTSSETFVAVIAQSILSVPSKRMTLSSIYNYIAKNYPHFDKEKGPGWRNSVRHNLSSNDCFVKASRAENGKGHYWMIHPKDLPEFSKGNFRRRRKPRRPKCSHSLMFRDSAAFLLHSAYQSVCHAPYDPYAQLRSHQEQTAGDLPHFTLSHHAAKCSLAQAFQPRLGLSLPPRMDDPCTTVSHRTPFSYPTSSARLAETAGAIRTYPHFTRPVHYPCVYHR